MKGYLTTILLGGSIVLTSVGIHEHNIICLTIAGIIVGIYSALIQEK